MAARSGINKDSPPTDNYAFLTQILDSATKRTVKVILDRLGSIEASIKALPTADPVDTSQFITPAQLQAYVQDQIALSKAPALPVARTSGSPTPPPSGVGTGGSGTGSGGGGTTMSEAAWKAIILGQTTGLDPENPASLQTVVDRLRALGYQTAIILNNGAPSDHKVWLNGAAWSFITSDSFQPGTFTWDPYIQVETPAGVGWNACGIPLNSSSVGDCTL